MIGSNLKFKFWCYSNSALICFINASVLMGFLMKQPMLLSGCTSLIASIFISPEVMKHTLMLISFSNIFLQNSKPSVNDMFMSTSTQAFPFTHVSSNTLKSTYLINLYINLNNTRSMTHLAQTTRFAARPVQGLVLMYINKILLYINGYIQLNLVLLLMVHTHR